MRHEIDIDPSPHDVAVNAIVAVVCFLLAGLGIIALCLLAP